jgi:hypothetical protein
MSICIVVKRDVVYGKEVFRPAGPRAEMLAEIAGTKTLLPRTLDIALDLGFEIVVKHGGPYVRGGK